LTATGFDRFVGVDWSGAEAEGQSGIQVAEVRCQTGQVQLVSPPNGISWSRRDVLEAVLAFSDRRTLVGLDFAFSVPWQKEQGTTPACLDELQNVRDLWSWVDGFCEETPHFYAGPIWRSDQSPFRPFTRFWSREVQYQRQVVDALLLRQTETAAMASGLHPKSIYQMVGPQVGAGSFAGMRVLNALASVKEVAIWPFDDVQNAQVVIAEIYPALFFHAAGRRRPTKRQIRSGTFRPLVNDTLGHFGVRCETDIPNSIDAIDALVGAAGVYSSVRRSDLFEAPVGVPAAKKEGWILGVPARGDM
jgi:hypothetical protein